ncbi:MAG: hypothetical protein EOP43_06125 [Sphingobacteriaceae bacterium]|nr:MAG: hypothetical protein EOP43_06125 [Sphingobacteriaceae bacterium]
MAKYTEDSKEEVKEALHKMKEGKLKIGKSNTKVTNPKQAIAIGLSEAEEHSAKSSKTKKPSAKKK